jgi:RND family efflux transporter MFP subunit
MKKHMLLLGLTLSAAACGDHVAEAREVTPPAMPDSVEMVSVSTLPVLSPVEGSVHARRRADISTRMMARIVEIPVEIGSTVKGGQTLVRLGTEDVAAGRAKAEAGVRVAQAARDEAARHAARMDTLYSLDVVPLVQRDQAHLGLVQAESQLAVAEATLREASIASEYARIPAPFDGRVVAKLVDAGDMANPGIPLLVVESTGARDAVLAVPVELAQSLEEGDVVAVSRPEGSRVEGRVRAVAAGADPRMRTVEVRVEVPADWPTGTQVTGLLASGTRTAVTIPVSAVVRRGQLTGVRVVSEQGVGIRWIRLGRTFGDQVEVLSGLAEGDRIAS